MTFLEDLVQNGLLSEAQMPDVIRTANDKYNGDIDRSLADFNISEGDILARKSFFYNIPAKKVDTSVISSDVLKYIPADASKHYHFVPIGIDNGTLEVGIIDPENIQATDALQFITSKMNMPYRYFLITPKDFSLVFNNYQGLYGEVNKAMSELGAEIASAEKNINIENEGGKNSQAILKPGEEEKIVEEAPIIKIVADILRYATEGNASDIHIENTGEEVKVRFRVDGTLFTSLHLSLSVYAGIVARIKILAKLRLDEKRKPQDGGFSTKIEDRKIDFRVSTFPAYYGEKVVMRILDTERGVKPLDALGLSIENLALIREAIKKPYGLILITGPTGSGKSTTLYSMLNELDREKANVVSLEDPVEYHMPDMSQSQVMPEIGYTFASGLRSILRQDPDIIFVGEIRDKETAQLAIQAALTGHLVLSTLHTNSAVGAVPRLVDMGVDPYLIAPTLILSIAQRLARVIYPTSKHAIPVDDSMKIMLEKQFADLPAEFRSKLPVPNEMYEAVASPDCPSGTRGRMAIFEMFQIDKDIQRVILKNPVEEEMYKIARSKGMLSMREDAIIKCMQGTVPLQEVYNF